MTFLAEHERPQTDDNASKSLCYYIDQRPDLDLLHSNEIISYCSRGIDTRFSDHRLKQEDEKRLACYVAILSTVESCSTEEISMGKPHLKKYFDWMKHQLSCNHTHDLSTPEEEWKARAREPDYRHNLFDKVQGYDAEGNVIVSVANNLLDVLSGKVDGLGLLFGENSLMEQYYRYAHSSTSAFSKVQRYVDALAHKNPELRVLEIGAGTGGATELILHTLMQQSPDYGGSPRFAEYVYTDISASFFDKAKNKYRSTSTRMTFATLNIEKDPVEQGFQESAYDLVIASHVRSLFVLLNSVNGLAAQVLHATRDIQLTLRNTRRLLKP